MVLTAVACWVEVETAEAGTVEVVMAEVAWE